jgi:hypothetical protein
MRITYDKEADALYIRLIEGEHQCRVVRPTDDIALDFISGEKLSSASRSWERAVCSRSPKRRKSN